MAEAKKTGAKKTTKATEPKDIEAVETIKTTFIRPRGIKDKFITGAINGEDFKVPYNEEVEVPIPVYERISWSLKTQDFADEYIEKVKADPEENV